MTNKEIETRLQTAADNGVGFSAEVLNYINILKSEKQFAKKQLKELLSALYKETGKALPFILERKDIIELAKDYGIKEEELNGQLVQVNHNIVRHYG